MPLPPDPRREKVRQMAAEHGMDVPDFLEYVEKKRDFWREVLPKICPPDSRLKRVDGRVVEPAHCLLPDSSNIIARAQAIIAAHQDLNCTVLTPEEEAVLRAVVDRARRANRMHPAVQVEVSPYVAALLRLDE